MASEKRTTTIELTPDDEDCIQAIKEFTGEISTIAAIRYALRAGSQWPAYLEHLSEQALKSKKNADPD